MYPLQISLDDIARDIAQPLRDSSAAASIDEALNHARNAHQQAQHSGNQREQAIAAFVYCRLLYRSGMQDGELLMLCKQTLAQLRAENLLLPYMSLMRWAVFAACDRGQFVVAMQYAIESSRLAEQTDDPVVRALSTSLIGSCFERSGDHWQGARLARESVHQARRLDSGLVLIITLNNLVATLIGQFYRLRDGGMAGEARAALIEALPLAREALQLVMGGDDAHMRVVVTANLGEVLVHLDQYEEAEQRLNDALSGAQRIGYAASVARIRCVQAELHLARDEPAQAMTITTALLTDGRQPVFTRMRIHYARYLAARQLGDSAEALHELEHYRAVEVRISLAQLKVRSDLMVTRIEAEDDRRRSLRRIQKQVREQQQQRVELERLALQDALTGLANRRALDQRLPELMAEARRSRTALTLVMLDVDYFKQVNDQHGHVVGDRVLIELAHVLSGQIRADDLLARIGGEELVLVLPGLATEDAYRFCERLQQRIAQHPWATIAPDLTITVSAGIASTPPYEVDALRERADLAMYAAKRAGRNRIVLASEVRGGAAARSQPVAVG